MAKCSMKKMAVGGKVTAPAPKGMSCPMPKGGPSRADGAAISGRTKGKLT